MDLSLVPPGAIALVGGAALVAGIVARARRRDAGLADILGLEDPADGWWTGDEEHGTVAARTLRVTSHAIERWDRPGTLAERIERADLTLRPAELVVIAASMGLVAGATLGALLGLLWAVPIPLVLTPLATKLVLEVRARRRAQRFAAQLPDALALVSGSLAAGHTFLRSIQLMADELEAPLADEFRRVVSETELGVPLVTSLDRMADRLCLRDVRWMVQAIRIQQTVGGRLSELLTTLAELMRSREEVRREIKVLTAEGRMSAWVLGALPVCLFLAVQVLNPGYLDPLLRGWGLLWLAGTATSVVTGVGLILRMVDEVEV